MGVSGLGRVAGLLQAPIGITAHASTNLKGRVSFSYIVWV